MQAIRGKQTVNSNPKHLLDDLFGLIDNFWGRERWSHCVALFEGKHSSFGEQRDAPAPPSFGVKAG